MSNYEFLKQCKELWLYYNKYTIFSFLYDNYDLINNILDTAKINYIIDWRKNLIHTNSLNSLFYKELRKNFNEKISKEIIEYDFLLKDDFNKFRNNVEL